MSDNVIYCIIQRLMCSRVSYLIKSQYSNSAAKMVNMFSQHSSVSVQPLHAHATVHGYSFCIHTQSPMHLFVQKQTRSLRCSGGAAL